MMAVRLLVIERVYPPGRKTPPPPSYSSPYRVSYGSLNTVGRAGGEAGLERVGYSAGSGRGDSREGGGVRAAKRAWSPWRDLTTRPWESTSQQRLPRDAACPISTG